MLFLLRMISVKTETISSYYPYTVLHTISVCCLKVIDGAYQITSLKCFARHRWGYGVHESLRGEEQQNVNCIIWMSVTRTATPWLPVSIEEMLWVSFMTRDWQEGRKDAQVTEGRAEKNVGEERKWLVQRWLTWMKCQGQRKEGGGVVAPVYLQLNE